MNELEPISLSHLVIFPCTTCGAPVTCELWFVIHKGERPDLWLQCIDDTINIIVCAYGHSTKMRTPLLLLDPDSDRLYYVSLWRSDNPIENTTGSHPEDEIDKVSAQTQLYLLKLRLGDRMPPFLALRKITREMMPTMLAKASSKSRPTERIAAFQAAQSDAASKRAPTLRKSLERLERSMRENRKSSEILFCGLHTLAAAIAAGDIFARIDSLRGIAFASDAQAIRSGDDQDGKRAFQWYPPLIDLLREVEDDGGLADALRAAVELRAFFLSDPDAELVRILPLCDEAIQLYISMNDFTRARGVADIALQFCDYLLMLKDLVMSEVPEAEVRSELCKIALRFCDQTGKPKGFYAKYHEAYADEVMKNAFGANRMRAIGSAVRAYSEAVTESETEGVSDTVIALRNLKYAVALLELRSEQTETIQLAEAALRRAASVIPTAELRLSSIIRRNLAAALISSDETSEAQYEEALQILQELLHTTEHSVLVETLSTLGALYAKRANTEYAKADDVARAVATLEYALTSITPAEVQHRSILLTNLAQLRQGTGETLDTRALNEANEAVWLATAAGDLDLVARLRIGLARHYSFTKQYSKVYETLASAIDTIEEIELATPGGRIKSISLLHEFELYKELVDACLKCQPPMALAAFEYADRSRARMFRQTTGEGPLRAPDCIPADELELELNFLAERRSLRNAIQVFASRGNFLRPITQANGERMAFVSKELDKLWEHFKNDFGAISYVARRRGGDNITLQSVKEWLKASGDAVAIASFFVLRDRTVAFVAHRDLDDLIVLELPISEDELRELTTGSVFGDRVLSEIGRRVVDPVLAVVPPSAVLYFVKHLSLNLIPMHAVTHLCKPLFCFIPIAHAASVASLLQTVEFCEPMPVDPELQESLVIGDPTSDLPDARREAETIAECLSGKLLCGVAADRRTILARIRDARIIHFAGHSEYDVQEPANSGLILSDGLLSARDLGLGTLKADLFVASSCSSGKQRIMAGDELWGLPRTLLQIGAKSAITALWDIPDRVSAPIMTMFYRLRYGYGSESKTTKASALARAMKAAVETGVPVSHCGAFVLLGDYR